MGWGLAAATAIAAPLCWLAGGPRGLAGLALGMAATGFSLWALWGVVQLLGRSAEAGAEPSKGSALVVLAFLVKLPLFVGLGLLAHRLGGSAGACFLVGLGLVYFALVAWALAKC